MHNPVTIIVHEFVSMGKTIPWIKSWSGKLKYLFCFRNKASLQCREKGGLHLLLLLVQ
jgi:hypothetical protein